MPHRRLADLSTDHDLPVQRATLLSLMFAGSAVLCLPAAWINQTPGARLEMLYAAAGLGVVIAAVLWTGRHRRLQPWVLQVALLLYSVLVATVAAHASTTNGVTSLGPAVIMTSAYAGYFFAGRAFWGQLAAAVGSYALGAVLAPPETAVTSILTITGVALALGIVLHRLTNLLRERTLFDPLTRAVSRATWLKIADGELHRSGGQRVTVAMIDLDEFKETNDLLGHLAGDQLLRDVATAWTRSLGRDGLLGRYGGDEFVVLFLDSDDRTVRAVLDRLERAHPVRWTVGFATAEAGDDLTGLLHRVDLELRVGKGIRPLRRPRTIPRQPLARRRTTQMVATEPESTR